jgi:hypothetical protein
VKCLALFLDLLLSGCAANIGRSLVASGVLFPGDDSLTWDKLVEKLTPSQPYHCPMVANFPCDDENGHHEPQPTTTPTPLPPQ